MRRFLLGQLATFYLCSVLFALWLLLVTDRWNNGLPCDCM